MGSFRGGGIETTRTAVLTPAMLKNFICTHQMEFVDEQHAFQLIQVLISLSLFLLSFYIYISFLYFSLSPPYFLSISFYMYT